MDRVCFFEKYNINEEQFSRLRITWDELMRIYEDYGNRIHEYEAAANNIAECLNGEKSIHSIKYRVKDKEHLIEKIIRKMTRDRSLVVTFQNYREEIRDLIGLRALHLFKENWITIHNFLAEHWEFFTVPKANYKKGDPENYLDMYRIRGLNLYEHKHGYRSVHYHLIINPGRSFQIAEIQVRTIFEEAWSEIDHHFRYSADRNGPSAEAYLGVLNNITSNADALASYINKIQTMGDPSAGDQTMMGNFGGRMPGGLDTTTSDNSLYVRDIYKEVNRTNQFDE